MKFQVECQIGYEVLQPSTLIFNIHALRTHNQIVLEETLDIDPHVRIDEFTARHSPNRFVRMEVNEHLFFTISYKAIAETVYQEIAHQDLINVPVGQLDGDIIPFLFPSRYCQSDKLQRLAYKKFGDIEGTYAKVLAITEWIYNNIEYVSGSTTSQTSAFDTITERSGVCRDFAHLGIALCRALSIPARYFTGYAYKLYPADFHACFEAYIGGHWIIFDATQLAPLNGLVKIANGRDAADAAVASIFGNVICNYVQVNCQTLDDNFVPFFPSSNPLKGLSLQ
ncbi:transglutaminase-like domain-containing protein [Adhaeribacter aquaticus]|uniref:transglutaminase-like domain-containing protein n=1 Tax=Adhaeribacter aquaticus TaxID=299567 RepID=UPI00040FB20C|nr:transglutaminase family protein [Adhaeribacter aquaticus]